MAVAMMWTIIMMKMLDVDHADHGNVVEDVDVDGDDVEVRRPLSWVPGQSNHEPRTTNQEPLKQEPKNQEPRTNNK